MIRIKLSQREWHYDPDTTLGKGGFASVFAGISDAQVSVAVKRLDHHPHRELGIATDLITEDFLHVMPILDVGQDDISNSYFVVMSLAEKSLQDDLDNGKTCQDKQAADILVQICQGLSEVPDIVHRDLKPSNILYHQGKWKVADFELHA